jgi:pyruvate dehydrogenase E2 component (dihydrolipoamide acetyltransferase)
VIIMPNLAQTSGELKILRWLKSPGDRIEQGDKLVEIETDKAVMEVEAYTGGYLREVLVNEGEAAELSAPIAVLTSSFEEPYESPRIASTPAPAASPAAPAAPAPNLPSRGVTAAPAARTRARDLGVDLAQVIGSGPGGLITRADVERFVTTAAWRPRRKGI